MHVLFKRIRNLNIKMICRCIYLTMLFYLLHCRGFEYSQVIENLHNDILREIVNPPIYMLHAEFGRHPIQINIKSRIIFSGYKFFTHISLAAFLWDIGKQRRPRSDAVEPVPTVCSQTVLLEFE